MFFRISKGNDSGNPIGKCPLEYSDILRIRRNLHHNQITQIDYEKMDTWILFLMNYGKIKLYDRGGDYKFRFSTTNEILD